MGLRQSGSAVALMSALLALSACGSSSGTPSAEGALSTVPDSAAIACTTKLPRSAKDYTLVVNIPSDSDPTAANITPSTKITPAVTTVSRNKPGKCHQWLTPVR